MPTVKPYRAWQSHDGEADLYRWDDLAAGDTVEWLVLPVGADRSVQCFGTFGGTVTIQGTNEPDDPPANPFTVTDPGGSAITFAAAGGKQVLHATLKLRPSPGAGVVAVTCLVLAVRR